MNRRSSGEKFHGQLSRFAGAIIMYGALVFFEDEFIHIVAISFTALILTELLMVALTIRTWHWFMLAAELLSLAIYIASLFILKESFGKLENKNRGILLVS